MTYIFLDESGDLGFGKRATRWFLCAATVNDDPRALERVTKKVWKSLVEKHKHIGELHAYREKTSTRKKMLQLLSGIENLKIFCVILDKRKISKNMCGDKNFLYAATISSILDKVNDEKIDSESFLNICIDRQDAKHEIHEELIERLSTSLRKIRVKNFSISLDSSHENKSLQAVDFISWAIFRKHEYLDNAYYEIIKDKIADEFIFVP